MRRFLVIIACMALLSGCTKSNIVDPEAVTIYADPNFETQEGLAIDWTQVSTEAEEFFENQDAYPYSRDFHFYLEPNKKEIMLMWVVDDNLPVDEILTYAEDMIKGFNDVVAVQDFSIEKSSGQSFGGLWKNYSLSFSIVPESSQDDEESWFMSASFGAGVEFVLPDMGTIRANMDAHSTEGETADEQPEPEEAESEAADDGASE